MRLRRQGRGGKRIQVFKSGFPAKGAADDALRVAIEDYENNQGKIVIEGGILGTKAWAFKLGPLRRSGFKNARRSF